MSLPPNFDLSNLDKGEVAALLNTTTRTIENYTHSEPPLPFTPAGKVKKYSWYPVLQWWSDRVSGNQAPKDLAEAKLLQVNLQNQKLKIEIEELEGRLTPTADIERVWSATLLDIRQALLNVSHNSAAAITSDMDYSARKEIIEDNIFSALEQVIKGEKAEK